MIISTFLKDYFERKYERARAEVKDLPDDILKARLIRQFYDTLFALIFVPLMLIYYASHLEWVGWIALASLVIVVCLYAYDAKKLAGRVTWWGKTSSQK